MSDIQLNLINNSNTANNAEIVIFQKNEADYFNELAVAWQVIRYCGQGDNHPFTFPLSLTVGASDSWGNYTPQLQANNGQMFEMKLTTSGDRLVEAGRGTSSREIQVLNGLTQGAITANIYRGGKLLACKTSISPQQKAAFLFKPTIWIGVANQIVQGELMNSAIIANINTELNLLGVSRADIVMTGGGSGPTAKPLTFTLENIVHT